MVQNYMRHNVSLIIPTTVMLNDIKSAYEMRRSLHSKKDIILFVNAMGVLIHLQFGLERRLDRFTKYLKYIEEYDAQKWKTVFNLNLKAYKQKGIYIQMPG